MVKFNATDTDKAKLKAIAERGHAAFNRISEENGKGPHYRDEQSYLMDLTAVHLNAYPLNLDRLLACEEVELTHDLAGFRDLIDRETGKMPLYFLPKCNR